MNNLPEDIEQMAKYLGREDPAIQRLLAAALRNPKMIEVVRNLLKRRCVRSGFIVHEYLLCQVEKCIGFVGPKWRLQRNSSVARDQGLQPDLMVMGPDSERIIVEICCSNLSYDAQNILIEAKVPGVDQVIAVTPDKQTKHDLQKVLEKCSKSLDQTQSLSVSLLDASECLGSRFDWAKKLTSLP